MKRTLERYRDSEDESLLPKMMRYGLCDLNADHCYFPKWATTI